MVIPILSTSHNQICSQERIRIKIIFSVSNTVIHTIHCSYDDGDIFKKKVDKRKQA